MSTMQIEIVANPVSTVPTAKGSYQVIDLAYKNKSFQDKLEGKKVMSFTNKDVFTALSKASFGDVFNVSRVKNDKGFWDWTAVSTGDAGVDVPSASTGSSVAASPVSGANALKTDNVVPKSNYETAEERAARQVLIVRQSSISSAVDLAVANKVKDPQEVIAIAKQFEAYVFGTEQDKATPALEATGNFFEDMEDDLP